MNDLQKRCVELSYRHKLTHISSVLNTVNVLDAIYMRRLPDEPVVLGNSHAGLALFVTLEKHGLCDAEEMIHKHGTHAGRDPAHGIWVSGGSLGQPETVAVGMALADHKRKVWLVTSDGACAEGAVWEAFHIAANHGLRNLKVFVIANGFGGYGVIDVDMLHCRLMYALGAIGFEMIRPTIPWAFLQGLGGHYLTLNESQYSEMTNVRLSEPGG